MSNRKTERKKKSKIHEEKQTDIQIDRDRQSTVIQKYNIIYEPPECVRQSADQKRRPRPVLWLLCPSHHPGSPAKSHSSGIKHTTYWSIWLRKTQTLNLLIYWIHTHSLLNHWIKTHTQLLMIYWIQTHNLLTHDSNLKPNAILDSNTTPTDLFIRQNSANRLSGIILQTPLSNF